MNHALVVLLGVAIVFFGLVCLVLLCDLINIVCDKAAPAKNKEAVKENVAEVPHTAVPEAIPNRGELIAAISAAIAEETGTDLSAIRILSFKKL